MKSILAILALLGCVIVFADSTGSVTVSTNSTVLVPMADTSTKSLSTWATGTTYAQGAYVRTSLLYDYWTSTGGTSTNNPVHLLGGYTYADGGKWYRIENAERRQAILSNAGTGTVWIAFGNVDAVFSEGLPLGSGERLFYEGQNAVVGVSAGTNVVKTLEEVE